MTWRAGVDVLCLGATKNGALAAEAVILFDPARAWEFELRRKRGGHLFSKMRFISAQMKAYLSDGLWLRLAAHSNAMADRLAAGIDATPGARVTNTIGANMLFPEITLAQHKRLQAAGARYYTMSPFDADGADDQVIGCPAGGELSHHRGGRGAVPGGPGRVSQSGRTGVGGFLDFIAVPESRGNWNAYFSAPDNRDDPSFVSMTGTEVLAWQTGRRFSACGRYQVIRKTLLSLVDEMGLNGDEYYDPAMQDRMGQTLLRRRGLDAFLAGRIDCKVFALSVAREWAALPGVLAPFFERSVYAGDGVNKALVAVADYLAAVDRLASEAGAP